MNQKDAEQRDATASRNKALAGGDDGGAGGGGGGGGGKPPPVPPTPAEVAA